MKTAVFMLCSSLALACSGQDPARYSERPLADVARIAVPTGLKAEREAQPLPDPASLVAQQTRGQREHLREWLSFGFSSTDFWASMGSVTVYRQRLMVSLMPPDASDADYAELPRRMQIGYENRSAWPERRLGSGQLRGHAGIYHRGSQQSPALLLVYTDRPRRLQLVWHLLRQELDADAAVAQLEHMAASFRIVRDPLDWFAAMRGAIGNEAAQRAAQLASVQALFRREGLGGLNLTASPAQGQAVLHRGVWVAWTNEPEPRYQLLLPLGRVRVQAGAGAAGRPRPLPAPGPGERRVGSVGWREFSEGEWVFSNRQNDYLPFDAIAARLGRRDPDPAFVDFYFAATVRVDEEPDAERLTSLRWFFDALPDVQARWRQGRLVAPGHPEPD